MGGIQSSRERSVGPHEMGTLQEQMRGLTTTIGIGGSRRQSQSSSARSSKPPSPIVTEGHQSHNQSEEEAERPMGETWTEREKALLKREVEKGHTYQEIADQAFARAAVGEEGTVKTMIALKGMGAKMNLRMSRPKPPDKVERVLNESEKAFLDSVDLKKFPRRQYCLKSRKNCNGRGPGGIPRCKNCQSRRKICNDPTRKDIMENLEAAAKLLDAWVDWTKGDIITNKAYTAEENKKLMELVPDPRGVPWNKLTEYFPGRTDASLRGHHRHLTRKGETSQAQSQQDMGASMHSHGQVEISPGEMRSMHQGTSEWDAQIRRSTQQSFLDAPAPSPHSPGYIRRSSSAESERQQSPQQQTSLPQISSRPGTPQAQSAHQGLPGQRSSPARQFSTAQASSSRRKKRTQQEQRGSTSEAEPSQASKSSRKKKKK